jgi:hypothetical protein
VGVTVAIPVGAGVGVDAGILEVGVSVRVRPKVGGGKVIVKTAVWDAVSVDVDGCVVGATVLAGFVAVARVTFPEQPQVMSAHPRQKRRFRSLSVILIATSSNSRGLHHRTTP